MCFGGGTPQVQPAPPPPKLTDPAVQQAAEKEKELARLRKGRASTLLTGGSGLLDTGTTTKKTLLGG